MGQTIKTDDHFEYRQETGETTAWFSDTKEKMAITHKSLPGYKPIFYTFIGIGAIYLILVFLLVH